MPLKFDPTVKGLRNRSSVHNIVAPEQKMVSLKLKNDKQWILTIAKTYGAHFFNLLRGKRLCPCLNKYDSPNFTKKLQSCLLFAM